MFLNLNHWFPTAYHKAITALLFIGILGATIYRLAVTLRTTEMVNRLVGQAVEQHNQGNIPEAIKLILQASDRSNESALPITAQRLLIESYFAPGLQQVSSLEDLSADCPEPTQGHAGTINTFAYLPQFNRLATGGSDGRVLIWNWDSLCPIREILGSEENPVLDIAFHPSGTQIMIAYRDGTISLRSVLNSKQSGSDRNYDTTIYPDPIWSSVTFDSDGTHFISGNGRNGDIVLWDTDTGEPIQDFFGHSQRINDIAFSNDYSHFVSVSDDGTARIWNISTAQQETVSPVYGAFLTSVAFAKDDQLVVFGAEDGVIRFWDLLTDQIPNERRVHEEAVRSIKVSTDGESFLSASNDEQLTVWNTDTREVKLIVRSAQSDMSGFIGAEFVESDNAVVAVTSVEPRLLRWSIISTDRVGPIQFPLSDGEEPANILPTMTGDTIGTYTDQRGVRLLTTSLRGREDVGLWQLKENGQVESIETFDTNYMISRIEFAPSGAAAIAGSRDGRLFTITNNYAQARYSIEPITPVPITSVPDGIVDLEYLPEGNGFVVGVGREIQIWNASGETFEHGRSLVLHTSMLRAFDISSDGNRLISADMEGNITIHSLDSEPGAVPILEIDNAGDNIHDVSFHPSGDYFYWSDDAGFQSRDIGTGPITTIGEHQGNIVDIEMSGNYMLTVTNDKAIILWDLDSLGILYRYEFDVDISSLRITEDQMQGLVFLENGEIYIINFPSLSDIIAHMRSSFES